MKVEEETPGNLWAALLIFLPNQLSDGLVWHTRAFCSHMKILSPTCCGCCASIYFTAYPHNRRFHTTLHTWESKISIASVLICLDLWKHYELNWWVAGFSALRLLVAWPMDLPLGFSFQLLERWRMARSYFVSPTQKTPRCPEICRDKPASKIISWLLTRASGSKIGSHQFSVLVSLL